MTKIIHKTTTEAARVASSHTNKATAGVALMLCMGMASCGEHKPTRESVALMTAKTYYESLMAKDYDSFVDGTLQGDTVPQGYKQQLLLNARMYGEQLGTEHKGVVKIDTLRCVTGVSPHLADAFLQLTFADSLREQVVVPMVEKNGVWYMR